MMYLGMVRDDPKVLGDSGEVPISEWSGWKVIPVVKPFVYLTEITSWIGRKPRAHPPQGSEPHHVPRGFLNKVGPTGSNSRRIVRHLLFIYLFILVPLKI